ncbi:hypothetical protein B0H10DRAFT_2169453 [Mycena sp. CBHHK59/15]|nr:hypothetical protein B0H10DRAFT_2169453 [Mycena sp. CBHHK59/15]
MPPKGNASIIRDEGIPIESRTWIAPRSAKKHLVSDDHLKAVEQVEEANRKVEELSRERRADSATKELRDIRFAAVQDLRGPVASGSSGKISAAEAEMWEDYALNGADFDAGEEPEDPNVRQAQLSKEADSFGLWNPEDVARKLGFGDDDLVGEVLAEDEEDDFLGEIMRNAGESTFIDEAICAICVDILSHDMTSSSSEWFPYPSKMMFLLDTLDNLPRLRISNSLMRVFLWVLKEAKCKDVPSFDKLCRIQKKIRSECGIPTIPCISVQGNVFFMNDPKAIIAKDWANPTTRKLIHLYPEIPEDGIIREIWHAQKWRKNMNLDILSPMYDAGATHYYVNEVSLLKTGNFVVPIRWVLFRGRVYANAFSIIFNDENEATIIDDKTTLICVNDLVQNYFDLQQAGKVPRWSATTIEAGQPARMPNPKRLIAQGDPLYSSFVDYFGDDVSGNRTKSWNKHWNAYMTHRNLPRKLLQQEFHVHFISTSPNAGISEQFREFKASVEETHTEPVQVQDETGNTTRFCIHVNAGPSDNPMQSEVSAHIGGKGNHFCRKCEVGGTQKEKATDEGYHALFEAGLPRTKERILDELEKQVKLACLGVPKHVKDLQTQTGIKDMYTQYWIDQLLLRFKEHKIMEPNRSDRDIQEELVQWTLDNRDKIYSAFLTMKGFDPTKDTPVEILHTILLGIVKYIWHISHTAWTPEQKQTYYFRLQSTATDGLSIHVIRANYIMQYAGSLIGRQFKTLAQTNVFHVYGLVTEHQFMAWKATGELAALLWFPEIRNLAEYHLQVAVANVLDVFAMIDPSKIISKIKYHLLAHIDEDVVEFGPLIGVATEIFECFNAIFRFCSILSNHLAPSRDIAIQLRDQEGLKHRLTGGWWVTGDNKWQRAGSGVQHFMAAHPVLQRLLGWSESKPLKHGVVKLVALKRGKTVRANYKLKAMSAARALNFGMYSSESTWEKCLHVISESLDECFVGSWVFALSGIDETSTISGHISDILVDTTGNVVVVVELFQVLSTRDKLYGMPVLVRRDSEITFSIVPAKSLRFKFNNFIVHNSLDRFIINSHAFHNAHLLRATLPRDLLAPIPLFDDGRTKHDKLAATLRAKRDTKLATQVPEDNLVAGRRKRTIIRSSWALALEAAESDEEMGYSDSEDNLYNSGDNYSD